MSGVLASPVSAAGPYLAKALDDDAWLTATAELIAGGRSNLTYRITSTSGSAVLRRPPTGQVLATAHDMAREQRVMSALAGSAVPVPRLLAWCPETDILGAPFYVMEAVEGPVVRDAFPDGYADTTAERRSVCENLIDTLATLHAVDPDAVGLADFGKPSGFLDRQLLRWSAQWSASKAEPNADVDALVTGLQASVPVSARAAIVHGDFRLDNVILGSTREIRGVLDWELSTLGDPLADLGLLLAYWDQADDPAFRVGGLVVPSVTALPGMLTRTEVADRYTRQTGADLADLDWYVAFAFFKLAVVSAGIAMRARAGVMAGGEADGYDNLIPVLAELGRTQLSKEMG